MKKNNIQITAFLGFILFFLISPDLSAKKWTITVKDFIFTPANLTHVGAMDTIYFIWVGGIHTTTSTTIPIDALDWNEEIDIAHQTYIYRPSANGTYSYKCALHPNMTGRFTVSGAGIAETEKPGASIFPSPFYENVTIITDPGIVISNYKVYDLNGKLVVQSDNAFTGTYTTNSLAVLPRGTYLLYFTTRDEKTFARRINRN